MSLWSRIAGLVSLAKVTSTTAPTGARGTAQVSLLGIPDDVERIQPFGFQSRPTGGEAVLIAVGGNRDDLVAITIGDRRFNLALEAGDVAIADNRGNKMHLREDGIVVVSDHVTILSPDVLIGEGPTYRAPVLVGDDITGLTSASGGLVTGIIAVTAPTTTLGVS